MISSNLKIQNNTLIYNEGAIIDTFVSTLTVVDSVFHDLDTTFSVFTITSSTINVSNMTFYNITATDNLALLTVTLDSVMIVNSITFYNSLVPFATCLTSDAAISNVHLSNITSKAVVLNLKSLKSLTMDSVMIDNVENTFSSNAFIIDSSIGSLIKNVTIKNIDQISLKVSSSKITTIDALMITDSREGPLFETSQITIMRNSIFSKLGGSTIKQGGGLDIYNTNLTMINVTLSHNTAQQGGGLYYS